MRTRPGAFVAAMLLAIAVVVSASPSAAQQGGAAGGAVSSFYDLKTMSLDGKPGDLAQYKGKVSLVVNVASKCGYTPQYRGVGEAAARDEGQGIQCAWFPQQ